MGGRKIAVGFDASSEPSDGFGIRTELYLGPTHTKNPPVGTDITRGETESLEYMAFGFGSLTHYTFAETNSAMNVGNIGIEQQGLLAFSNPLGSAVRKHVDDTQNQVGFCMVRGQLKRF